MRYTFFDLFLDFVHLGTIGEDGDVSRVVGVFGDQQRGRSGILEFKRSSSARIAFMEMGF